MIVVCPKCETRNNIPDTPDPSEHYRCAKCGAMLVLPTATAKSGPSWFKISSPVTVGVLVAIVVIIIAVSAFCIYTCQEVTEQEVTELEILSHEGLKVKGIFGVFEVTGTAKNVGAKTLNYSSIECRFYDSAGNQVDTLKDSMSDLGPGQTWAFEVVCYDDRAVSYNISVGSCW